MCVDLGVGEEYPVLCSLSFFVTFFTFGIFSAIISLKFSSPFYVSSTFGIPMTHVLGHLIFFLQDLDVLYVLLHLFAFCFFILDNSHWVIFKLIDSFLSVLSLLMNQSKVFFISVPLFFSFLAFSLIPSYTCNAEIAHMILHVVHIFY